jgi:hypothetical protein
MANSIYSPSVQETARKAEKKRVDKAFGQKIAIAALAATGMQFWFAQLIIWGLSLYRIHSGIWGPWLILDGLTGAGVATVALGMMRAVRDTQSIWLDYSRP